MTESRHQPVVGRAETQVQATAAERPAVPAMGWPATLLLAGLCGMGGACATPAKAGPSSVETERTLVALRAKNAGYQQRIEELENRIFVLEDQLDSRRVASQQRGPTLLPARTIRPDGTTTVAAAPPAAPEADPAISPDDAESSVVAEQVVEYEGDALRTGNGRGGHNPHLSSAGLRRPPLRLSAPEPVQEARARAASSEKVTVLRLYRQALEALRAGNQPAALAGFRRFLEENPRHAYADNAQYWIGECFYDVRDYRAAEPEFRRVIERYPHGNKVPDAMLKLGFTLLASGQTPAGTSVLESLTRAFPKHDSARLASFRLAHPEEDPVAPARLGTAPTLGTVVPLPAPPALVPARASQPKKETP
ncbi:MAG TPA: tol-pal system protein YbgF [Polyangia bacterium]|nr:tol-pal system protein YbgF [Polyangia bacterium]